MLCQCYSETVTGLCALANTRVSPEKGWQRHLSAVLVTSTSRNGNVLLFSPTQHICLAVPCEKTCICGVGRVVQEFSALAPGSKGSVFPLLVAHSWTDSRNPQHSAQCVICSGQTHWKTSAMRRQQNISLTIASEVAHISTGMDYSHGFEHCWPYDQVTAIWVVMGTSSGFWDLEPWAVQSMTALGPSSECHCRALSLKVSYSRCNEQCLEHLTLACCC